MTDRPKFNIGFGQSVSSGIINFHADLLTNDLKEDYDEQLLNVLKKLDNTFSKAGYLIASDIKPKDPDKEKYLVTRKKDNNKNGK